MLKVIIKAESFNELIEKVNQYFHYNRMVEFVGGPFLYEEKNVTYYCQKITILVK
jgi:hypothetical protein